MEQNNSGKGCIIFIVIVMIIIFFVLPKACSSSVRDDFHEKEVERVRDELYKKGSDGLYYLK